MSIRLCCLCVLIWGTTPGCHTVQTKPEGLPFHSLYDPITEPEALRFLQAGIHLLETQYGPLKVPIRQVHLRRSTVNERGRGYRIRQYFSLTEEVDLSTGEFAIYIEVGPEHSEFYPLLGHEIGHLKYPGKHEDWEVEGFCMVFSEQLCLAENKDWSVWKERFTKDSEDPYARAYWKTLNEMGPR